MRNSHLSSCILGAALVVLTTAGHAADVVLSPGSGLPLGSGGDSGFVVRTVQGPITPTLGNTLTRALKQLNGTLLDGSNQAVPNEAGPGPLADGSHVKPAVSFDFAGLPVLGFSTELFPGIPGTGVHYSNFVVEAVAFLELNAGTHTLGMAVSADRTDANDDDGYVVFSGVNLRSFFATRVGAYQRTVTQPFQSNQLNTNYFTFVAPVEGLYPFRVVYWQTGLGFNLNFFVVRETGQLSLINDPLDFGGPIPAYYTVTGGARANGPYVAEVSPLPGVSGIAPGEPISVLLADGANPINDATVKLFLNNVQVTPQSVKRDGSKLALRYDPSVTRTVVSNLMRIEFEDTAGLKDTNSWQFSIVAGTAARTLVTGQWDFELLDLSATVGQPLQYLDGPGGATEAGTKFGTCASLGVALINGEDAKIMEVPYVTGTDLSSYGPYGYIMAHGISPNGGGTRVNQFTLIMDVLVDTSGGGAASLLNMSTANNTDGDLFWQGNNFGQGGNGYNGAGTFTAGEWHRIAIAYDEAATPAHATKYVDGIKQDDWTAGHALDNDRRSLAATALLFADGDGDNERRKIWVNSIQIRSGKLSDAELAALGGPSSGGIPATIQETGVTGQWDFDVNNTFLNGYLAPTVGKPLQYLDGAGGATETGTRFGTCSALGVALLNGEDASIMEVPYIAGTDPASNWAPFGYIMTHGIAPNGGGTRVNQFTLIMDVLVDTSGGGAASLLNMSTANNTDGDLFWQANNFGQGGNGYNGAGTFTAGEWHRVAIAYDEAATPAHATKYVDGIKQDDWTAGHALDNDRRSLAPTAILFADGDGDNERRKIWVNSIQIRAGKLSDAELIALGTPSATGIPTAITLASGTPKLAIVRTGNGIRLGWPANAAGYRLESTTSLSSPDWQEVSSVANTADVVVDGQPRFFRLVNP